MYWEIRALVIQHIQSGEAGTPEEHVIGSSRFTTPRPFLRWQVQDSIIIGMALQWTAQF